VRPLIYSLANAGLALGSDASGDADAARKASEDFLSMWRDAEVSPPAMLTRPTGRATSSRQ